MFEVEVAPQAMADVGPDAPGAHFIGNGDRYSEGGRVLLTEMLLPRIARLASNCLTGNCLSTFNKRISSKM